MVSGLNDQFYLSQLPLDGWVCRTFGFHENNSLADGRTGQPENLSYLSVGECAKPQRV
jgi:hypothetical protein